MRCAVLTALLAVSTLVVGMPTLDARLHRPRRSEESTTTTTSLLYVRKHTTRRAASSIAVPMPLRWHARTLSINALSSLLDQLCVYRDGMLASSNALGGLATLSEPGDLNLFGQQCSTQASAFQNALAGYSGVLGGLDGDTGKGIANLDRSNDLELTLNDVVTYGKDFMKNIDAILYNVPAVGNTLGPLVYEVKCSLDDVLNSVENMSDGTMNSYGINLAMFQPQMTSLIVSATTTACGCDVPALSSLSICL